MLLHLLIAALTLQDLPREFLDRKVRDGKEQTGTALDDMTMGQLMKLTAMPGTRLGQIQCAGYGLWLARNGAPALPPERLQAVHGALGRYAASFAEMDEAIGYAFVALYAEEADESRKSMSLGDFASWRKAQDARCAGFFKAAGDGSLTIRPLAPRTVIDPRLNGCHALYRAAAALREGQEAAALTRQADRAAELALKDKTGPALAAARAALDEEAADAATASSLDAEAEMMQLTLCVPLLRGAKGEEGDGGDGGSAAR